MRVGDSMLRPTAHLAALGRQYPGAWRLLEDLHHDRAELGGWPDWCYVPLAGSYAVISGGGSNRVPPDRLTDVSRMAALGAWRLSQGVYRYHPELLRPLWESPLPGRLPAEVLQRLPEWCVYLDLSGSGLAPELHGSYVHLEYDTRDGRAELRLLLDLEQDDGPLLWPIPIHLGGSLEDGLAAALRQSESNLLRLHLRDLVQSLDQPGPEAGSASLAPQVLGGIVSLVLYLCSQWGDLSNTKGATPPTRPAPVRTKQGPRLYPPPGPTVWQAGYRLGEALRRVRPQERGSPPSTTGSQSPAPHIRRAHWHTYWTGPRREPARRVAEVRWLPPIPVGVDLAEDLIPTIRLVK